MAHNNRSSLRFVSVSSVTLFVALCVIVRCLLTGRETRGAFSLTHHTSEGRTSSPIHLHEHQDETVYVLEGQLKVTIAGVVHAVNAGEARFMPRGIRHRLANQLEQPSRYAILCNPSGFEDFVAATGMMRHGEEMPAAPSANEIERLKAETAKFGIRLFSAF